METTLKSTHRPRNAMILALIWTFVNISPILAKANQAAQVVFEFSKTKAPTNDTRQLAVAFHSITYIDSVAHSLGEVILGTSQANAVQGEGWFSNDNWPDVGSFQWTGGSTKRAVITLTIPQGTEGLLLKINSIEDTLWMTVKVDGQFAATLRVDAYWHSGYVPIGQPRPVPKPSTEPVWVQGRYFPNFPNAERLYVFSMRTKLDDHKFAWVSSFRMDQDHETMMALTLVGMQGIINRYQPSVYLDWNEIEKEGASRFWIPFISKYVDTVSLDLDGLSAVNFLMRRYRSWFSGAVIYNPEIPDVINLATMYAGLENRVMLAPKQVGLSGIPVFSSVLDLRPLATSNAWDTSQAGRYRLYKWVYDTLWSRVERRIIAVISPGPRSFQPVGDGYNPFGMAGRDYIVALKLPALWLDVKDSLEADLFSKFLREAPSPIPVTGVFGNDEVEATALVSRHGDWVAAIHWPNAPLSAGSLTAFSGVRPSIRRYQAPPDPARILSTLHKKHITTIWCSDGDNIQYQMDRGFHGGPKWVWERVQGHRFGWTINPTLIDLAPVVWNYYVDSRRSVTLVGGLSGAGYTYPELMSNQQLGAYLGIASTYLNESGLRTIWIDDRYGRQWDYRMATNYYQRLQGAGILGAFWGTSGFPWGLSFTYTGTPFPASRFAYQLDPQNGQKIIDDILARKPGEEFVDVNSDYPWYNRSRGRIEQDSTASKGEAYRLLKGNAQWELVVWGPYATLAPGEYTVSYRLKVPDNVGTTDFAQVYVGRNIFQGTTFVDWMMIARRTLRQNDFNQPNKYQEFTVTFRLDTVLADVEFRIDYSGAVTDLFVDYIRAVRKDSLDFPVMAPVFISLVQQPPQRLTDLPRFAEDFEAVGGVTLTPEEFLAVTNPEFMIEFAKSYVGANHPSITTAQNQLAQKDYIGSLITIRKALRPFIPSAVETISAQPQAFRLHQNYPNPFNPSTTIQFSIPKASHVKLEIFNLLGQKVETLINGHRQSGLHTVAWNPQSLASGIYFYRLQAGEFVETKKLILIR